MKIVHVCHLYHPSAGGIQTYFKKVSERLVRDYGDDVTVVTTDSYYGPEKLFYKKITPSHEVINGVKVIRFAYTRWHIKPLKFIIKILRKLRLRVPEMLIMFQNGPYSKALNNYLKSVKADAIFASSSNYYYMQLPLWRKCNFYYFASIHLDEDISKTHLLHKQIECMNSSTLYIANTQYEADRLVKAGLIKSKAFVLGCGVDMEDFVVQDFSTVDSFKHGLGIPPNALVAGYVGRIEKTKNVELIIDAFLKLSFRFPQLYLLIAGTAGDYVNELKAYISTQPSEAAARIIFVLDFRYDQKPLIFHALDILVLPSKNESFGLVFLEAWSCKKPVIGTSIGALRDVIDDGCDGFITKPDDADDIATKIEMLISNTQLRLSMGQNGYNKVQQKYTWDIIVARLRQCYINALEKEDIKTRDLNYVQT